MKIRISNIDDSAYTIREKLEPEQFDELKKSLEVDGQWDPIIVRPKGDGYELISGHRRVQASKELGWTEIEATVKDVDDIEALFLALKTNIIRQDMSEREQGKVLHRITQEFGISGPELARKIGKRDEWVRRRIKIALDLHDEVAKALEDDIIIMRVAEIIASLDIQYQAGFLKYIIQNKIERNEAEVRKAKKRYLNNTIYTIGYEGTELKTFIEVLKNNGIEYLFDVRFSTESQFKPDFSKPILSRELERAKIHYVHKRELGVPYEWQNPYKDGAIPFECFDKYYRWHLLKELDFSKIVDEIKESGRTALMCYEKHATPKRDQKIYCHRSILATRLKETGEFKELIHL
ncbi:ParB/RepB/Spo0J family partition protein [Methanosarcina sp. KYL-1]|uniref:ParB/RepB/Spo0J family partition protein n=1 Tax=Methanosarcina sp. KYL-1 TaxID=2602068 RepID=UPI00210091C5|nr:ParB/RepB/Spo0J family partition protein [Methanosarcina sp. KYL-1]MCQ1534677.1 ParB/RepB/Spo0J family partition protein [Methanosarcina sp. KYL-1]